MFRSVCLAIVLMCLIALAGVISPAKAQTAKGTGPVVTVLSEMPRLLALDDLSHWRAPDSDADLAAAQAAWQDGRYQSASDAHLGVSIDQHWFRIDLHNAGNAPSTHILALNRPFQALAEVTLQTGGTQTRILTERRDQPFAQRLRPERQLLSLPIHLDPGNEAVLWVRHGVDGSAAPDWVLLPPDDLAQKTAQDRLYFVAFYTAACIAALFMLGFVVVLRTWTQFFFMGFFFCLLGYNAQLDGHLFQFVWPQAPIWNAHASHVIGMAGLCCATLGAYTFVSARARFGIYRALVIGFVAAVGVFILVPVVVPIGLVKAWAGPVMLVFFALHFTAVYLAIRHRPAGWALFILGSVVLIGYLGLFSVGTQIPGLLPPDLLVALVRYGQILDGTLFSASAIVQSVGLRREAETNLLRRQQLEATLSATRHDLQQPLLAMRGALKSLEDAHGPAEQLRNLGQSITFLEDLAQPVRATRRAEPVALALVMDGVQRILGDEASARDIALRVVPSGQSIHGDPLILLRAVSNLVTNALRHSGCTRVLIGVLSDGARLRVLVVDDGHGFDADAARLPKADGHGLGLNATRDAVESIGWNLQFHRSSGGLTIAELSGLERSFDGTKGASGLQMRVQ